jgi:hypothetical protein
MIDHTFRPIDERRKAYKLPSMPFRR